MEVQFKVPVPRAGFDLRTAHQVLQKGYVKT